MDDGKSESPSASGSISASVTRERRNEMWERKNEQIKRVAFLIKRADMWDPKVREKRGGKRWMGEAAGDGWRRSNGKKKFM